jgi:phosphatidylserine decarboxylase
VLFFIRLLPRRLISLIFGHLARARRPRLMTRLLCRVFARVYRLDLEEAEVPAGGFDSLESLFVRTLKPNRRPAGEGLLAPCDGMLTFLGEVSADRLFQVKGLTYSASELLFGAGPDHSSGFCAAQSATVYLSPQNYHRVHAPIAGHLVSIRYVRGDLWPVNRLAVHGIPNLFCRNERLIFELRTDTGARLYLVMVGALNVGRMNAVAWPELWTNSPLGCDAVRRFEEQPLPISAGQELGVFHLGSTVVLVWEDRLAESLHTLAGEVPRPVKMGETLARPR